MNIFVVSFLAVVCTQFIAPSILHSLTIFCRAIISVGNIMTEYLSIPNAFGKTINDSQKQNIKGSTDGISNSNSTTTVNSDNNNADKKVDSNQNWSINFIILLTDSAFSVYRMFAALGLSFVAAILIGITAARKPLASKIIIPIIDILQSVPILGFFPAAIAFFITLFNGSSIGIELAAIFLIFTSMTWNMIFSVYESVLSIPSELLETSYAYRANPFLQLRRLYLPASIPKLIYNSIMSWAGGWYFLTAAEIISLGSKTFTLSGLGSLLGNSVSSGQYIQAIVALALLILIIMVTDFFFWRPLESYANRFKYDYSSSSAFTAIARKQRRQLRRLGTYYDNIPRHIFRSAAVFSSVQLSDFLSRTSSRPLIHIKSKRLIEIFAKIAYSFELRIFPVFHRWFDNKRNLKVFGSIALPVLIALTILLITQEGDLQVLFRFVQYVFVTL